MTEADATPDLGNVHAVLVTGAGGFVGRRLCAALEGLGRRVVTASSRAAFDPAQDPLPLDGVDHVVHAAARTGVPAAWADPAGFVEVNALGTLRVLEQAPRAGAAVSPCSAPTSMASPTRCRYPKAPLTAANNPYALSKVMAEEACAFYARAHGLRTSTLRLFNLYGPGQGDGFLVPKIARQALNPRCAVVEVADLQPKRDYVYIDDAVDAILRAIGSPPGSVFNVGSGTAHSVEQVVCAILAAAGSTKPYRGRAQRRPNEIDSTVADIGAIRAATGWRPRVAIEEGLRHVVEAMGPR